MISNVEKKKGIQLWAIDIEGKHFLVSFREENFLRTLTA